MKSNNHNAAIKEIKDKEVRQFIKLMGIDMNNLRPLSENDINVFCTRFRKFVKEVFKL